MITSRMLNATCPTTNALRRRSLSTGACESSLSDDTTSALEPRQAGASPDSNAATNDSASPKMSTRPSIDIWRFTGNGNAGNSFTTSDVNACASSKPPAPPSRNNITVSVRSCRTSRARPAPTATRRAISRRRAVALVRSTPARFAHAIIRTTDTSDMSSARKPAAASRTPEGIGEDAVTLHTRRPLSGAVTTPAPRSRATLGGASLSIAAPMARTSSAA